MDTGIFTEVLNGFPGIYTHDIVKMLDKTHFQNLMTGQTNRVANILQVVAYYDGNILKTFSSGSRGKIVLENEMKDF
jgi:inosine/xanthosine triphosphate pyrophosphatase family protein